MAKTVYRSLKDLDVAHYFAYPPESDQLHLAAPDGSVMTILACVVPTHLWRWDGGLGLMVHTRTGRTAPAMPGVPLRGVHQVSAGRPDDMPQDYEHKLYGREPHVFREIVRANAKPVPPRKFKPGDFNLDVAIHPSEYFTQEDVNEVTQRAAQVFVDLCALGRFLPYDQQLIPKLAVRLRELAEREVESTLQYGKKLAAELKALSRASLDTEIDLQSIEQKQRSLHYLRSQHYLLAKIQRGFIDAYGDVVEEYEARHGRKWYVYKTISERGTKWRRVAAEERRAEVKRLAMADQLTPVEFARYMANLRRYDPAAFGSGVDGQDEGLSKRMVVGRKMVGDHYEPDSVRRVRGDEESLAREYGDDRGDWGPGDRD